MKYTPKQPPEGINASQGHPIKEFFLLTGTLILIVLAVVILVGAATDVLVRFIPAKTERAFFSDFTTISDFIEEESPQFDDHYTDVEEIETYLADLVESFRRISDDPEQEFSIRVLNHSTPNAFVMPGGYIFITTGALGVVKSENGLAMILAHEMAHQYARHPLRRLGKGIVLALGMSTFMQVQSTPVFNYLVGGTLEMSQLTYSRDDEREADKLALELLKRKYGHIGGANEFFHAVQSIEKEEGEVPAFLSTHPRTESRIAAVNQAASDKNEKAELVPLPTFFVAFTY